MQSLINGTTRTFTFAVMALALLVAPIGCDDDDPVAPSTATELAIADGNNQTIIVGEQTEPLVVQVLDQFDDPMAGVSVTWTVVTGDGTLSSATTLTDDDGEAEVLFTAGTVAGAASVTATVSGLTAVTFLITVNAQS
jgi:hypothetical protein